jgi:Protein of unknown function (DUF4065)
MNPKLKELVIAIVSRATESGVKVSKTKLLKLLYLFDIEWYRTHQETFTGFDWKFYLLGPWTDEYDPTLDKYEGNGLEREKTKDSYGTEFIKTDETVRLRDLFKTRDEEIILEDMIRTWAKVPTEQILDHVYFRTEPMDEAIRDERLDFGKVSSVAPRKYRRTKSSLSKQKLNAMRDRIAERLETIRKRGRELPKFQQPDYDESFLDTMEQLEQTR